MKPSIMVFSTIVLLATSCSSTQSITDAEQQATITSGVATAISQLPTPTKTTLPTTTPTITPEATNLAISTATLPGTDYLSDLCKWYFKTQLLRVERVVAESDLLNLLLSPKNIDTSEAIRLLTILNPREQKFISDWKSLGYVSKGQAFWEKELLSIQTLAKSFDLMLASLKAVDRKKFDESLSIFGDAQKIGVDAQNEMLKIADKCTPVTPSAIANSTHANVDQSLLDSKSKEAEDFIIKGEYSTAIVDYTFIIQQRPDDANIYAKRGLAYTLKGDLDPAIADFNKAIQLNPEYAYAYFLRGDAYGGAGKLNLAIADFDEAIQLKPDLIEAYNDRGFTYFKMNKLDLAVADYDKAIQLRPDFVKAYGNRGIAHRALGQRDKAIADFRKVLELSQDPNLQSIAEEQLKEMGVK